MNIFRIFQGWKKKAQKSAKNGPAIQDRRETISSKTPTALKPLKTEPNNSIVRKPAARPRRHTETTRINSVRWIEPGTTRIVAGRDIGGMVYLGPAQNQGSNRALIVPSLPVAKSGPDIVGDSMPYWPSYSGISPSARAAYLDWLASGRSDQRYGLGHIFLYFYGLERRFFMDTPGEEEKRLLIAEVERLLRIYGANRSVHGYLGSFLDIANATLASAGETEPRFESGGYEIPLRLRITIGRMAGEERPLTADWLLSWYFAHPEYQLRTPANRAFPEFRSLFMLLFDEQYSEGIEDTGFQTSPPRPLPRRIV